MKSVLFIIHEDSFSGAPMALLRLLEILNEKKIFTSDVLILNTKGDLQNNFARQARNVFTYSLEKKLYQRALKSLLAVDLDYRKIVKKTARYDIVFFNTAISLRFFGDQDLANIRKKILLLYEMPVAVQTIFGSGLEKLKMVDIILVPSKANWQGLITLGVDDSKIKILNQYLDPEELKHRSSSIPEKAKKENRSFNVGMIGSPYWAKGLDYFLGIANRFKEKYPDTDILFRWKGIKPGSNDYKIYHSDVVKAGLEGVVVFEGSSDTIHSFYESLDVLALSSREDSFPYIMMEAALYGKPTVCFEQSGGAESFISGYGGLTVPFLSIDRYADVLFKYYLDREVMRLHGQAARERVLKEHCDKNKIIDQFTSAVMSSHLQENNQYIRQI